MPPVGFVGAELCDDECEESQDECNIDVPGYVGAERKDRDKPQQVVDQYKEEYCQQVRHEFPVLMLPDVGNRNIIPDEENNRLKHSLESFGCTDAGLPV